MLGFEDVGAVVIESSVYRYPMPDLNQFVVNLRQPLRILTYPLHDRPPSSLPDTPISTVSVKGHLRKCLLLTLELYCHGSGDGAVLRLQFGLFDLQWDVLFSKGLDIGPDALNHQVVARRQVADCGVFSKSAVEGVAELRQFGLGVLNEV